MAAGWRAVTMARGFSESGDIMPLSLGKGVGEPEAELMDFCFIFPVRRASYLCFII